MKTLTCVYTINDTEAFQEEADRIQENSKSSEGQPWAITAMSIGHEIYRLELIEQAHEQSRHDLLDEILGMVDPTIVTNIADLESDQKSNLKADNLEAIQNLINGVRSINRARQHEVTIQGDDDPCYLQRKEWVEWILGLAEAAEKAIG